MRLRRHDRIGDDVGDVDRLVDDAVDERGIGAVLQQAPHEVRQQVLVAAHRRIHAAGPREFLRIDDLRVQFLAHAVQALELVVAPRARIVHHARQRVRVVRRKLRIERFPGLQGHACACEIGNVGVHLAREHGIALQPQLLRVLDLGVPVGALDEAHRYPAADVPGQGFQEAEYVLRAPLVGLHSQPETVVRRQSGIAEYALEDLQ